MRRRTRFNLCIVVPFIPLIDSVLTTSRLIIEQLRRAVHGDEHFGKIVGRESWVASVGDGQPGEHQLFPRDPDQYYRQSAGAVLLTVMMALLWAGATISTNAKFTLSATASAPSGATIDLVNFYLDNTSTLLAQFTKAPFTCPIYPGTIEPHATLFAIAHDTAGGITTSASITVTFKGVTPTPPARRDHESGNGA